MVLSGLQAGVKGAVGVPSLTTTNKEAVRLYREIVRTARHFTWPDKDGVPWGVKLIQNARKEFEEAREERDPEIINRLLLVGRDCLMEVQNRVRVKNEALIQSIEASKNQPAAPRWKALDSDDDGKFYKAK
eukprot:tig00021293_g20010.t1